MNEKKIILLTAIGTPDKFIVADHEDLKHIRQTNSYKLVKAPDGHHYPLYEPFGDKDQEALETLMASGKYQVYSNNINTAKLKRFAVTVARPGVVYVDAETEAEAMKMANAMPSCEVDWAEDWTVTDAVEEETV